MVEVTQADRDLAEQICGCATPEQRRDDAKAIAAHREAAEQGKAELVAALEACRAWHYAEAKSLGNYRQRGDLCAYSEWKTQKALASVHPSYQQGDYKPVPVIFGEGTDEQTVASWVQELIEEETQALKKARQA